MHSRTCKKYFIVGTNGNALHDTMNGSVVGELIRCKDCKFYHKTEDDQFCGHGSVVAFDEHYCSIAERIEENGK